MNTRPQYIFTKLPDNNYNVNVKVDDTFFVLPEREDNFKEAIIKIGQEFNNILDEMSENERDINFLKLKYFYILSHAVYKEEKAKAFIKLMYYKSLAQFAIIYNHEPTYDFLIDEYENKENIELFRRFVPFRKMLQHSHVMLNYYSLLKKNSDEIDIIDYLLHSKYYMLTLYDSHICGDIKLSDSDFETCCNLLALSLSQLSRWYEPIYYYRDLDKLLNNPEGLYLAVNNLDSFRSKSCLNTYPLLLLVSNDFAERAIQSSQLHQTQIEHLERIKSDNEKVLKENDVNINGLREHLKIIKDKSQYSSFQKFCLDKHLYLNEHYIFCKCEKGVKDNLSIKSNHEHTQIPWTLKFETLLQNFKGDFIVARKNFYLSMDNVEIESKYFTSDDNPAQLDNIKNSLLKDAFKICYSILDQIGLATLEVMGKDYADVIDQLNFINIWSRRRFNFFTKDDYNTNWYLISLYSIARDLFKNKEFDYAALSDFKDIRNEMEHRLFIIRDYPWLDIDELSIHKKEKLTKNTELLLVLTKSAISSFVYLVRRASREKVKGSEEHADFE